MKNQRMLAKINPAIPIATLAKPNPHTFFSQKQGSESN